MIAGSRRDRALLAFLPIVLVLLLPIAVGIAIPLATPGAVFRIELALVGGGIGFALFYRFARSELSLVSAFGSYLLVISSVFVTMDNLRVQPAVQSAQLPTATVSDILLAAAGVVLIVSALVERHAVPTYPLPLLVGAGMLTLSVVATLVVQGSTGRLSDGVLFLIGALLTPVVVAFGARTRKVLVVVMWAWLVSGAANGAIALLDVTHVTQLGEVTPDGRTFSLTTQPNILGLTCAMLIPVGMAFFLALRTRLLRALVTILTVCAAVGVALSGSRAATLAAAVGLLIVPVLSYRRRFQALVLSVAVLVGAAILYLVSSSFFVSIQRLTGALSVGDSNEERIEAWKQALDQIYTSPLIGSGFSTLLAAHDLALQLLVSGGIIALVGYALFAGGVLRLGVQHSRHFSVNRMLPNLSAGLTASVLVFLVAGVVSNEIFNRFLYWPFGLILAIAFVGRRTESDRTVDTEMSVSSAAKGMDRTP